MSFKPEFEVIIYLELIRSLSAKDWGLLQAKFSKFLQANISPERDIAQLLHIAYAVRIFFSLSMV